MEPLPTPNELPETAIQTAEDHENRMAKARDRDQTQTANASARSPASVVLTVILISLAGVAYLISVAELMFVVPRFERVFLDFKLKLPLSTEWTISVSRFAVKYWYLPVLVFPIAVGVIFSWMRYRIGNRVLLVIFGSLFVVLLVANVFLWISLILPERALLEGLGGVKQ